MTSFPDPMLPDAVAAATQADPRAEHQRLASPGLFFDQRLNAWVAASPAVVREALGCPVLMVRPQGEPVPAALTGTLAADIFARLVRMNDGPTHAVLKAGIQSVLDSFDDTYIQQVAEDVAHWFVMPAPLPGSSVTRFNYGLPTLVLAKLYGIDERDWSELIDDVLAFVRCVAPGGNAEDIKAGIAAADRLMQRLGRHMGAPGPLLHRLLDALDTSAIPEENRQSALANAIGLWFQACEGTAGLIGQGLLRGRHCEWTGSPAQWIESVLNDLPPIQNTRRFVASDSEVAGCPLHAGDTLLAVLASHDPAGDGHLAFGHGPHACPGARWARAIATAGVHHLKQLGVTEQTLAHWQWRRSLNARVPEFH